MRHAEMKQAPSLDGLLIALAMGLVAFGVAVVVGGFGLMQAAFVGGLIAVVAGFFLCLPGADRNLAVPRGPAQHDLRAPVMTPPASRASSVPLMSASPVMTSPAMTAPVMTAPVMAAPVMAAPVMDAPAMATVGQKPQGLAAARNGAADDLKEIKGIGPKLEVLCHSLGFYHFDQIAQWTAPEIAWVDENLEGFKGRVTRDDWVGQARMLAAGGSTEHSRRVEQGGLH